MLKATDMGAKNFQKNVERESGSALLASLMLVVLITGAGLSAMTASSVNANKSKNVVGSKQALYLAEAALNHGKMVLHQNIANWPNYYQLTPQTLIPSTSLAGIGSYTVTIKAANNNALLMTATGTVTSSNAASQADSSRSVSTLVTLDNSNTLGKAWIGKNLTISGSPTFSGTSGGVHTNGNLTISGSPTIATNAEATGTYTVTATGHPTVAGFAGGGQPQQTINPLNASQLSGNYDYYFSWTYNYNDGTYHGLVYQRGVVNPIADVAPGQTWNCWKYTSYSYYYSYTQNKYLWTPFTWTTNCQPPNGTYFVYGEVKISGDNIGTAANPWVTTILAYGSIEVNADSLVIRPPDKNISSDVAAGLYKSQTQNLLFVANMDVLITGNANQNFKGITTSYEQIGISGNPVYYGYIMPQSMSNTATIYWGTNLVDNSYISGNMQLTYNGDLPTGTQGNAVPQATLY